MATSYVEISNPALLQATLSKAREAGTPLKVIKGDTGKPAAFINDDNFRKFRKSAGKDAGAIGSKVFMSSKDIPTQRGADFDKPEAKKGPERQYKSKRVAQAKKAVGSAVDKTKSAIKKVPQLPGIAKVKTQDTIAKKFDQGVDKVINRVKNPPPKKPAPKPKPAGAKKPSPPKPGDPIPNTPIKNPKTTRSSSGRSVQVFDNLSQKSKAIEKAKKDLVDARRAELNVSNYRDKNPSPSRRMPLPPPSTRSMTGVESQRVPIPRAVKNRAVRGVDISAPQSGLSNQQDSGNMRLKFKTQQMRDAMGMARKIPGIGPLLGGVGLTMAANEGQAKGESPDFNPLSNPNVMDFGIDESYAGIGAAGGGMVGGLPGAIVGGIGLPIAAHTVAPALREVQKSYNKATHVPERRMDTILKMYPESQGTPDAFIRAMQGPVTERERYAASNPFDIGRLGNY